MTLEIPALSGEAATARNTSEALFRELIDSLPMAIAVNDRQENVIFLNRKFIELFGYTLDDIPTVNAWWPLAYPDQAYRQEVRTAWHEAVEKAVREKTEIVPFEFKVTCKDGREREVLFGLAPVGDLNLIVFNDITERRQAEQLLAIQTKVLEMVAGGTPLSETLDVLAREIEAHTAGLLASVLLLDSDGIHVHHGAAPSLPDTFIRAVDGQPIGERAGSCGTAVWRREQVIVEDIDTDPLWSDYRGLAAAHGLRACWSTPIFAADNRVLGTFALYYAKPALPTAYHQRLIAMTTHCAAIAITSYKERDALRESEAYNRMLFDRSPIGLALAQLDGKLLDVNSAYADIIGRTIDETLNLSYWDITPEKYAAQEKQQLASLDSTGAYGPYEKEYIHKDGHLVPVRLKGLLVERNGDKFIWSSVEDITESKWAEEEISRVNQELRTINKIILICATTLNIDELLNKVMLEALDITGLEGGTICFVTPDETLHIAAHRATSQATLEDLTSHAVKVGDCLCGQCARDLKPLILRDREAVLEFSTREATRGEDIRFHAAFPLVSGERCVGVLCVFTRTDAKPDERSLKLLETVSSQIGMAIDNAQLYAESVRQNVTLEAKVEARTEELAAAVKRLKEIDRLKSMFIASMSHELRTPLNSVIGFSSILQNEWCGALNDEQKKNLTSILRSGKHLLSLINDVIDVSKIEAGMIEIGSDEFDLAELLAELEHTFARQAQEQRLFLDVQLLQLAMRTDRRRLLQCLFNLVSNAIKFTEQGGIAVAVQHNEIEGTVTISVTDSGIGVAAADQTKLFRAFSRIPSHLTAKVLGTGLGLYLTKKIVVEILHGDIIVTSEAGQGSVFSMTIPVRVEP